MFRTCESGYGFDLILEVVELFVQVLLGACLRVKYCVDFLIEPLKFVVLVVGIGLSNAFQNEHFNPCDALVVVI